MGFHAFGFSYVGFSCVGFSYLHEYIYMYNILNHIRRMLLRWQNPALKLRKFLLSDCLFKSLHPILQGHNKASFAVGRSTEWIRCSGVAATISKPLNSRLLGARRGYPEELSPSVCPVRRLWPWASAPGYCQRQDTMGRWF